MIVIGERRMYRGFVECDSFTVCRINDDEFLLFTGKAQEYFDENLKSVCFARYNPGYKALYGVVGVNDRGSYAIDYYETKEEAESVVDFLLECRVREKVTNEGLVVYLPSKRVRSFSEVAKVGRKLY